MCDFSLQSVRSRPAKVGDKLVTRDFGTGTRGFSASEDPGMAVCILPGTELAFTGDVACLPAGLLGWKTKTINHQTAIFRQVNKDKMAAHHDAALATPAVQSSIEAACAKLGLKSQRLPSGAGHDAQMMALLGPMGMIFVPSVKGISHSPMELTSWEDCARGADVLLHTVLEIDRV